MTAYESQEEFSSSPSSAQANMKDIEKGMDEDLTAEDALPPASVRGYENGETKDPVSSLFADDVPEEEPTEQPIQKEESQAGKMGKTRIFMIILSLCIALFLGALDMTIITTALPTIASDFEADDSQYTWVGSSYLLSCAAAVPAWGKFSDIFGRKPILLVCNVIFMAGSLFCALSTSINMLIGARVLQGIGGGGLIVLVNICIADLFSLRERGKYLGFTGMVWAIAAAVGPVVGGVFSEKVSWRWCFYINLPLDGFSVIMLICFLKLHTPRTPLRAGLKAIDWMGILLIVGGLVMFLLGLEAGGVTRPWDSAYTLCLIIFGVVTIGIFVLVEWRFAKYPVIPVHLFEDRTRVACLLTAFCHGFVYISLSYFLPLYFQTVLAATPLLSGVWYFPFAITLAIASSCSGLLIRKTGAYQFLIWGGMGLFALGIGLMISLPNHRDWAKIIIFQIIAGVGVGPNFQAPLVALQTTIKPSDIATSTAAFGFVRQISTSISIVLGGVVFQNEMSKKSAYLVSHLGSAVAAKVGSASSGSSSTYIRNLPASERKIVGGAITDSLRILWIFYTAIAVIGLMVSLFIGKKKLSKEHSVQKHGLEAQEKARLERKEEHRRKKELKESKRKGSIVDSSTLPTSRSEDLNGLERKES